MGDSKVKLSFVVPIYGVEAYLDKCVQSLLAQNYSNYEIILVDDKSPDNCPKMCDEYAVAHNKIKVVHREKNGGLSAARNSGITVAKGEYICFVDSDDYWNEDVLGDLMAQIERDNLDVLRFKWQYVNAEYQVVNPYKSNPYSGHNFSSEVTDGYTFLNERQGTACYAWQYILRTELVKDASSGELFTEGILFEDTDWTPRMLLKANHIASADRIVSNYLIRIGSITNETDIIKQKRVLENKLRLIGEMKRQSDVLRQSGKTSSWFDRMIAATVVSIVGMIAQLFWKDRNQYIQSMNEYNIFPLKTDCNDLKIRLINFNLSFAVFILHIKNR